MTRLLRMNKNCERCDFTVPASRATRWGRLCNGAEGGELAGAGVDAAAARPAEEGSRRELRKSRDYFCFSEAEVLEPGE